MIHLENDNPRWRLQSLPVCENIFASYRRPMHPSGDASRNHAQLDQGNTYTRHNIASRASGQANGGERGLDVAATEPAGPCEHAVRISDRFTELNSVQG